MNKDDVIRAHGPWTAHNIEYSPGEFTIAPGGNADWIRERATFYAACAEYSLGRPFASLRTLDLGCLEGGMSFHFAKFGAKALGLEVRESNVAKCNFTASAAKLDNLSFIQGDMLDIPSDIGKFDVILAAGILYHVDAPDLLGFLTRLREICSGVVIFDTHVAMDCLEVFEAGSSGKIYGRSIVEHEGGSSDGAKDKRSWASHRNDYAFWPTERSLMNLLNEAGFVFAYKPMLPFLEWPWKDRGIWIADTRKSQLLSQCKHRKYRDPDARPQDHPFFGRPEQIRARNPSTKRLYD
ncbi:class I SAM-dependent methyltransferase [Stappia indica]|uniref:Methyltransferase domain-containing protein n=1 Tax=Stappia indica TaxID=538381 RepID=A0A857CDC0_9HYPH|nr:class I SAM-dependent methyltransferase [Stappia indica]QGZ37010.1 methyltransferase domain-containing protein [Stappia indica]